MLEARDPMRGVPPPALAGPTGSQAKANRPEPLQIPFGRPCLSDDDLEAVAGVLRSGWIGMGPKVQEFEEAFRAYVGSPYAIATSSCTAALHLALVTAGLRPGQEVITTPLTFVATANAILYAGGTPVWADVDPATYNLDPRDVRRRITQATAGILPVHFAGLPCPMDELREVARARRLFVVEDAAHAIGSELGGKRIGGTGGTSCFSFYPNKNITTIEGGMLATDDKSVADRAASLRQQGLSSDAWERFRSPKRFLAEQTDLGFKYNMNDVAAALGLTQLAKIERFLETRAEVAALYDRRLGARGDVVLPPRPASRSAGRHAWNIYAVRLRPEVDRDRTILDLRARGIGAALHYRPVCCEPYHHARTPNCRKDLPAVHALADRLLTLPIGSGMNSHEADLVADAVESLLEQEPAR